MTALDRLLDIVARNRAGEPVALPSWCTAHPGTLKAVLRAHSESDGPVLIEATCNQVNQHGGYTGMTPADYRDFIWRLADDAGIARARVLLGGDHLGPNPWRGKPAAEAMAEAKLMVRAYVEAGFSKIHLDASMRCADDGPLAEDAMAGRAADLCAVAEAHSGGRPLAYVIGTEVPVPGGEAAGSGAPVVTASAAALATFATHLAAFETRGLTAAASRVIGIVVQPGVDFGNSEVWTFDAAKAAPLAAAAGKLKEAAFEAHSTDYQPAAGLRGLVAAHFAILKVGPELTFAFREAVLALAAIEAHLDVAAPSRLTEVIEAAMLADPRHWQGYIPDDARAPVQRLFGLSDRVRYYWPDAKISASLTRLYANVDATHHEPGLIAQYTGLSPGEAAIAHPLSQRVVEARVGAVVAKYRAACGA